MLFVLGAFWEHLILKKKKKTCYPGTLRVVSLFSWQKLFLKVEVPTATDGLDKLLRRHLVI